MPANARCGYEVLTIGRIGIDLYPVQIGTRLEEVDRFARSLGGSPTNVAIAAARHGRKAAVVTRVGDDPFGRFARRALREFGVDDVFVEEVPGLPTPLTFCEVFPPDRFPLWFYRFPKAPDLEIRDTELDLTAISQAAVFWTTATGLSLEPSRSAHLAALRVRDRRDFTVMDLDYRAAFWASSQDARDQVQNALQYATVAIGNLDEVEVAIGRSDPEAGALALLETGVRLAVVKRGSDGVLAMTREGTVEVPRCEVEVLNGLGAGDGFGGALCHGLLSGWPLVDTLRFANAAGAIVASRLECSSAMPTTAEVEDALRGTWHGLQ